MIPADPRSPSHRAHLAARHRAVALAEEETEEEREEREREEWEQRDADDE